MVAPTDLDAFPDPEEVSKREALRDPGPAWREWFLFHGAKAWVGLAFLIVDVWIAELWISPFQPLGLGLSLAFAVYVEFLAWRYLWYRPEANWGLRGFRPSWLRPRAVGRWTPEEAAIRRGEHGPELVEGPDPSEFL